jgi:hypothetical protein
MSKFRTAIAAGILLVSQLTLSQDVASAVTGTFNCGTSGTYTVIDGVLQGSNSCTGALVLDSSVTRINYATGFYSTAGITSITIPATTTTISYYAISSGSNKSLVEYVVDPNNPNYSSADGILYNKDKTTLIAYPYGKNELAFTVPSSVTQISYYAFNCLSYVQTVNIGATALSLDYAFSPNGCGTSSLRAVEVDSSNPNYSSLDGVFFNKNQTNLLMYPMGKLNTSYVVPSTVTTITKAAYNPFLTSITLPNGLRTISGYAFESSKLTSIFIPDSVTSYSGNPFINSDSLTNIDVGENNLNFKSISGVIYSKDGKTLLDYPAGKIDATFEIPAGVETLGSQWNWYNNYLRRITVPSSVTFIDYGANRNSYSSDTYLIFSGNSALTSIQGSYAKNIIYCGTSNSAITSYATSNAITVRCQTQAPDFALSTDTLIAIKSTSFTGYTISSSVAPDYYSISPTLSSGLSFNTTTGLISGTPSATAATTSYSVTGSNGIGSITRSFTLTVEAAPAFTLSPTTLTKSVGTSSVFYSISSTGGTIASYSISPEITNTPGLSFSTSTGLISGTPTQASSARTYTITATNAFGSANRTFTLTVTAAPAFTLSITSLTATVGSTTSFYTIASTGGAISSFSISPSISSTPGLSFSTATGLISGIPTQSAAARTYTITATNSVGSTTQTFTITVYTVAELAAIAAAQKAAEELAALQAAMELRRQQIEAAKAVVIDLLKTSKPVSVSQFQAAEYRPVSPKVIDRLNSEILKLAIDLRLEEKRINDLIDALNFDQAFYDVKDRPTVDIYNLYGIPGITARILSSVNDAILLIPSAKKTDLSVIKSVVLQYATVDLISNPLTRKYVTADQLVRIGLISADNKNKTTILNSLKNTPADEINTYEKLKKAISIQLAVITARADRLAAIKKKIQSRISG